VASYNSRLLAAERHARILEILEQQEIVSVAELRDALGASQPTVRRDIASLAEQGAIERIRGGARVLTRESGVHEAFVRRRRRNANAKRLIGEGVAARIPDGASLILNDGSTTYAVAQALHRRGVQVRVTTSALNIAELLAQDPARRVTVVGGHLPHRSFGTVGPQALAALRSLGADFAILGCDGIHESEGTRANSVEDARVVNAMAERADTVIIVADSSKWGNLAQVQILDWADIDELATDWLPASARGALASAGVLVSSYANPERDAS
jgi:DeoR/GlpR family transcriptional regulator of sugar metabolism